MLFDREKILFEGDTKFEHYQVIDMFYEGRDARVLFSGNKSAAFSGIPRDDDSDLLFDYIQRFFELVATIRPEKLLIIGGGTYTLSTALLHALDDIYIDVVEIDEGLDPIAEAYFGFTANERLNVIHDDGKNYLQNTDEMYDMIIIDAFTHLQIPASLASTDTPELVSRHLKKDGIMAMNIISSYQGRRAETIERFYRMYAKPFRHTTVYPADVGMSLWLEQNFVLVADKATAKRHHGLRFQALAAPGQRESGTLPTIDT